MLKIARSIEAQSPRRDKRARLRLSHELDVLADKLMREAEMSSKHEVAPAQKQPYPSATG